VTFDRFAVVRVPFPFTDPNAAKNRPALVLSDRDAFNAPAGHSVMAMITSAAGHHPQREPELRVTSRDCDFAELLARASLPG